VNNLKFITLLNVIENMSRDFDTQVNRLTEAMYLVHKMLDTAHDLYNQIKVGAAITDLSSTDYTKKVKEQERLKEIATEGIKSLPSQREYKDAISILQQYAERPGVKKLLGDVYREYPELNPKLSAIAGQNLT
jgi:hypothetical protein